MKNIDIKKIAIFIIIVYALTIVIWLTGCFIIWNFWKWEPILIRALLIVTILSSFINERIDYLFNKY